MDTVLFLSPTEADGSLGRTALEALGAAKQLASAVGKARALAGVAQRLGGRVDTHASGIAAEGGAPQITRWFYKQRMEAKLARAQRPWIVLLDAGSAPAWRPEGPAPAVEPVAVAV